jgi:hypothetical protein
MIHTGVGNRGVQTTTFRVHPRIRLAQLFQADGGGPVSPLRSLGQPVILAVHQLQVRLLYLHEQPLACFEMGLGVNEARARLPPYNI